MLVFGLLWLALPFLLAYWIYQDAASRGNDSAALWALAAGGFTFLTFFGGFLVLAVYLWDRDEAVGPVGPPTTRIPRVYARPRAPPSE